MIFIICVLLVITFIVYAPLAIIGFVTKHYTVFNITSNRMRALMKEGLIEGNIEFTADKTNIYLCESPVKVQILNRPLHTTTIIFKKCTDEMASKLREIIEEKIKKERRKEFSAFRCITVGLRYNYIFLKISGERALYLVM